MSASPVPCPKFLLGQVVATPNAVAAMNAAGVLPVDLLQRHVAGDWGTLPVEDIASNEQALQTGARLLSSYPIGGDAKICLITEADRSSTTLLLPEDY